jgi:hypothetical protein
MEQPPSTPAGKDEAGSKGWVGADLGSSSAVADGAPPSSSLLSISLASSASAGSAPSTGSKLFQKMTSCTPHLPSPAFKYTRTKTTKERRLAMTERSGLTNGCVPMAL